MNQILQLSLILQARQPNELNNLAETVSNPNHSAYGQYLNRSQLAQYISLEKSERAALEHWLQSFGMICLPSLALANQELIYRTTAKQLVQAFGIKTAQQLLSPRLVSMASLKSSLPRSLAGYIHTLRVLPDLQTNKKTAYWGLKARSLFPEDSLVTGQ